MAVPGTTTKNMLVSPLEQLNILSSYDFSPFILTGFDMLSNELLFWVHFTIFNNPVSSSGGARLASPPVLAGPPLFHFWVVTHFFVTLETAVLGAFSPSIYSISALAFDLERTAGLTAMATVIDSVPGGGGPGTPLSFLWSALRANANLLYSPDHPSLPKVSDPTASSSSETCSESPPDTINTCGAKPAL